MCIGVISMHAGLTYIYICLVRMDVGHMCIDVGNICIGADLFFVDM